MSQVNMSDNMSDDDDELAEGPTWWRKIRKHLNFYRIHVIIITPIVFSGIFYASNGRYPVAYIDGLYSCVSAMTVCGLTTLNLSALTGWQQAILFIQMCIGNPVVVSWVTVYLRRHYFAIKFEHVLKANAERKAAETLANPERRPPTWPNRVSGFLRRVRTDVPILPEVPEAFRDEEKKKDVNQKLRPDMIRRMDDEPKRIDPSGFPVAPKKASTVHAAQPSHLSFAPSSSDHERAQPKSRRSIIGYGVESKRSHFRRLSDPGMPSRPTSPVTGTFPRSDTMQDKPAPASSSPGFPKTFTRTQTIEFAPNNPRRRGRLARGIARDEILENEGQAPEPLYPNVDHRSTHSRRGSVARQPSLTSSRTRGSKSYKHRGFGGFPMPFDIVTGLFGRFFPKLRRKVTRTVTMPVTTSLVSQQRDVPHGAKAVPYISFSAIVGRNSAFHRLSQEEMEELGGVEYRALNALLWIVGGYHIISQVITFIVIVSYISMPRWRPNFVPPAEMRPQSTVWFSVFQAVSAYTNTGMSLVDHSMVPFQTAYPMVIIMIFAILAGNTAFPIFLRFTIWSLSKLVPKTSRAHETLHFLLDHPRRCFIYLFPSHQTWFLLTIVCGLTATDWFFFLVLDIGNPGTESIPLGIRFLVGLFQAVAVRAAGFSAVSLSVLAAGVKVLYVIMMYISVYPIAMSIRSTNVYEEQSLGIFPDEEESGEEDFKPTGHRVTVWSRYLAMHARKQLAFDMWWVALALFLICVNERHNLDNPAVAVWFNIFTVIFELVSAYGTVGLSLGTPNNNFSLSGELRPLSKFILCLVMLRGRHRILPVAIDRAVMLPSEMQRQLDQDADTQSRYNISQSGSHPHEEETTSQGRIDRRRRSSQIVDDET
ncbi:cation transport protein-domain-containing protein [Lyophyllum atratum]|nr:cation transport protein-domain-containing protein [Lyophyllum atratum]